MVGLGVRDASGAAPGRTGENKAAGVRVRCDLPLEKGFVMTVEPGIYFIPALLNDPARREKFATEINWNLVDSYLDFGGMRIEDNLLITDGAPVNLTIDIPV
jgi:Xaa-Pro aminopeptidase